MTSPFFFPTPNQTFPDVKGYSILIGALSSGNIPQLTLQSILSALPESQPLGVYHDPASVEPFVTTAILPQESTTTTITTTMSDDLEEAPNGIQFAIELYVNHTIKTIIVVQRARIISDRSYTFIKAFCSFLQTLSPSYITMLTSLGPSHRPAEHKDLIQFFTVEPDQVPDDNKTKPNPDAKNPIATILQTEPFSLPPTFLSTEEVDAHAQYLKIRYGENNKTPLHFPIPIKGGGLTRQFAKFSRNSGIPFIGLVSFPGPGSVKSLGQITLSIIAADLKVKNGTHWDIPELIARDLEDYC